MTHTLEKAIKIFELLANTSHPMRLLDISNETGIHASTASRLLSTLKSHGYVNQDPLTSRYSPSLKLFHIGCKISHNISIIGKARPILELGASQLKRSLNYAILQNEEMVVLDVIGGAFESPMITIRSGNILPLYCTALGRAIMCYYRDEDVVTYCASHPLVPYTNLTITTTTQLIEELHNSRERGYAYDRGEIRNGIAGVGVAIPGGTAVPHSALSVAFLSAEATPEIVSSLSSELQQIASAISHAI